MSQVHKEEESFINVYSQLPTMLCKLALKPNPYVRHRKKIINHFKNSSHFDVERLTNVLFFLELNKCKPIPRCEQGSFFNWDLRLSKLANASEKEVFSGVTL